MTANPRKLLDKIEGSNFYGSLELIFRNGKLTYIKKTETFAPEGLESQPERMKNSDANSQHTR
jgi:hypothetical protein